MKKYLLFIFLILVFPKLHAQNVQLEWVKEMGGIAGNGTGKSIITDALGYVYTMGGFSGTVDFDPGPGIFNLSCTNYFDVDIYISKLNVAGDLVWTKQIKADGSNPYNSMTLDSYGNILITGHFYGTVDFDPGPGIYNLTSASVWDSFISKLDNDGNFVWAKQIRGVTNSAVYGYTIAADGAGNVYTSGGFHGLVDFNPGPADYFLGSSNDISTIYVSKLDANGNFIWAKQMIAIVDNSFLPGAAGISVAVDTFGNVYTTGSFIGTIDFDPGPAEHIISSDNLNYFISKLDAGGNFIWAKCANPETSVLSRADCRSIKLDASSNIFLCGHFEGIVDFDPGNESFNMAAPVNGNLFISKLDIAGNFIWAKQFGGYTETANTSSIDLDTAGNIYAAGNFKGLTDFDPGPAVYEVQSSGHDDIFISKFDTSGDFIWAKRIGGSGYDGASSITVTNSGNVYTTGLFENIVDFDTGPGIFNVGSWNDAIFVHKMVLCTNRTYSSITISACNAYTLNAQTYTSSGVYTQTITNAADCDSIITLNLTINGTNKIFNASSCGNYLWNGQNYTGTGTYSDTLIDVNGCDSIITLQLIIKPTVSTTANITICPGENYAGYTNTHIYIDTLVAANGCDSIRTLNLNVKNTCIPFGIPSAFTPNGDGLNDLFKPTITQNITEYSFIIFNRYGQKIFETRTYPAGWDGTFNGKAQPVGTYIFFISYLNSNGYRQQEKGTFLLLQ